jgi:AP-2 complex subunit mu-1
MKTLLILFWQVVAAKQTGAVPPIQFIEGCTFLYTRYDDMFFMACTRSNVNPGVVRFEHVQSP